MIVELKNATSDAGHYFLPFCDGLRLREVVAGPRCSLSSNLLTEAVQGVDSDILIFKGRLAFNSFKVEQASN